MNIYIIRHGQKEPGLFLTEDEFYNDNPLSKIGKEQSSLLKEILPGKVDAIFVSELKRTSQTIVDYANHLQLDIKRDSRINEIRMGVMLYMSKDDIEFKYPDFWKAWQDKKEDFVYPEGECGRDVADRIKSFISEIMGKYNDVVIVSHEGWIRIFICIMLKIPFHERFKFKIANCGACLFHFEDDNFSGVIETINDCSYLKNLITYDM